MPELEGFDANLDLSLAAANVSAAARIYESGSHAPAASAVPDLELEEVAAWLEGYREVILSSSHSAPPPTDTEAEDLDAVDLDLDGVVAGDAHSQVERGSRYVFDVDPGIAHGVVGSGCLRLEVQQVAFGHLDDDRQVAVKVYQGVEMEGAEEGRLGAALAIFRFENRRHEEVPFLGDDVVLVAVAVAEEVGCDQLVRVAARARVGPGNQVLSEETVFIGLRPRRGAYESDGQQDRECLET